MMADSDQQLTVPADQAQSTLRLAVLASDTYTLLLVVGLLVLLVSLAVLGYVWFDHYGPGPKPLIGKITAVSADRIRVDLGARQGLQVGHSLLVVRRGVFLADLSVKAVDNDGSFVVLRDARPKDAQPDKDVPTVTFAKGDTVVFSPLDAKP